MSWVLSIALFVLAAVVFIKYRKQNNVFYVASGYFFFWGLWWFLTAVTPINFFEGIYLIIFRVVSIAVLIILSVVYFKMRKNRINS